MEDSKKLKPIRPFKAPPHIEYPHFEVPHSPVDIEIGCGVGLHPILYHKKNPERTLIAIEHTREKFEKFKRRHLNHGSPENIIPIHANAITWISQQIPDNSIHNFYFLYPNPNPKASDLNKRWYAMPFMNKVLSALKDNGEIILATNEKFYADEASNYFLNIWNMELSERSTLKMDFCPRTHFERKYLERGQDCYNLIFTKKILI